MRLNETHDPSLRSWVSSANDAGTDFPIQNLPFGIFRRSGGAGLYRGGVAIGDQDLDLDAAWTSGAFPSAQIGAAASRALTCARRPTLNDLMSLGAESLSGLRLALSRALREGSPQ